MNNNSGAPQEDQQYPQDQSQQSDTPQQQCKECGLYFDTTKSLDVHMHFTHENKLNKWSTIVTTQQHSKERNNNNTKPNSTVKREFITNNPADNSDSMAKKSPEYNRATPEAMFGHPPTPQSYQSASSPYQNQDNTFSPSFPIYQHQVKVENLSPTSNQFQNNYSNYSDHFLPIISGMDASNQHQSYNQEYAVQKMSVSNNSYRYHPYSQPQSGQFERQIQPQVQSSSPAYPPQPTPSPSPKTCDKCGYVFETATQLIEHLNLSHPPTPAPHISQQFMYGTGGTQIKLENTAQDILDLDSQKVFSEDEKRLNSVPNSHTPHSVSSLIENWNQHTQVQNQQKMFQQDNHLYMNNQDQKLYSQTGPSGISDQKLFQSHQIPQQEYIVNAVPTTQEPPGESPTSSYRAFEHLPSQTNSSLISSSQVPSAPTQSAPSTTKSASWKSNEARRPKTYNCTACNKWFTSSGHLKRHYNTTLHKNAVKSSGQPDPATLPISAHHHPTRESTTREDRSSNSPSEDSRDDANTLPIPFERQSALPGLLQQPPSGPYDRQPAPNIHQPPPLHSPMAHGSPIGNVMVNLGNLNSSNGSPPNGEAGLSTVSMDSRGLLSLSANHSTTPGFNMAPPMMHMENNQFPMYPNEPAPHVTQNMAINSLDSSGEFQFITVHSTEAAQPLPSFAQINAHRYGLLVSYENANVGGGGPVTAPYSYITENPFENMEPRILYRSGDYEEDYKPCILEQSEQMNYSNETMPYPSSPIENISSTQEFQEQDFQEQDFQNNNICEDNKIDIQNDIKIEMETNPVQVTRSKRGYEKTAKAPKTTADQSKKKELKRCIDCDKTFNRACYLTQHNKTFHSGEKPYKCVRCGKRYGCINTFERHVKKHAGEKPHKCEVCPKQFNHKTDLRRHMCLHTGYKPFKCETCDKGFIRKDHMLKHFETHARKAQKEAR